MKERISLEVGGYIGHIEERVLLICIERDKKPVLTPTDSKIIVDKLIQLLDGKKGVLISDVRNLNYPISKTARAYISDTIEPHIYASAIVVQSGASKILGNILLSFAKKKFSRKIFTKYEDALQWAKSCLPQND